MRNHQVPAERIIEDKVLDPEGIWKSFYILPSGNCSNNSNILGETEHND